MKFPPQAKRYLFIILAIIAVVSLLSIPSRRTDYAVPVDYSDAMSLATAGAVKSLTVFKGSDGEFEIRTTLPRHAKDEMEKARKRIAESHAAVAGKDGVSAVTVVAKGDEKAGQGKANLPGSVATAKGGKPADSFESGVSAPVPVTAGAPADGYVYSSSAGTASTIDGLVATVRATNPSAKVEFVSPGGAGPLIRSVLPFIFIIIAWLIIMRFVMRGQFKGAGMFGKGKIKMIAPGENKTRLSDVAGCEEAKVEAVEFIQFLRNPEAYLRVGAKPPRGVLLDGPPGTGKTLMAMAVAGEAGVPFFQASGSEFVEMFVGVGASRVRELFDAAKALAPTPAIVFIDEIDAIGQKREGGGVAGRNDEREQTLNQLLVEMDGFSSKNSNIVVMAATNRPQVLDPALRRAGRFDRLVTLSLPNAKGREQILSVHARNIVLEEGVNLAAIARGSVGFSGADLANLVNEAAILAGREGASAVSVRHFDQARDKVLMGPATGIVLSRKAKEIVAYHEAGHAIVGHFLPDADPVHKISILPRGRALGVTMSMPDGDEDDIYNHTKEHLMADIAVLLGGRAAEDVALGTATTGAANDFDRATAMARRIVGVWGMSRLGVQSIHGEGGESPYGATGWSESWKKQVDDEAVAILSEQYSVATGLLRDNMPALHAVAHALIAEETVEKDRFLELVGGPAPKTGDRIRTDDEDLVVAPETAGAI